MSRVFSFAVACLVALFSTGCTGPFYRNQALKRYQPTEGYRFDSLEPGENNTDELFVCLSFSGGGTRAAAFAYGVLEGLRDTAIAGLADAAAPRRLLDEVDVISSVSGGSFTAMGYALWRDGLFNGEFVERFLERDVELDLLVNLLRPRNLLRLPFYLLDSIDVAATYYDERVFDKHTYGDLLRRNQRPFVVINATDVARRQRFEFTQGDFDLLGSDLAALPVGWAVAASSAFPVLLSPMRLKYYPSEAMSSAIEDVLAVEEDWRNQRRARWASSLLAKGQTIPARPYEVDERRHRYLYLLDGGLADNLGLTYFIEAYRRGEIRHRIEARKITRLVVITVDARTDPPTDLESRSSSPGMLRVFERTGTTSIDNHSTLLSAITKYALLEAQAGRRKVHEQYRETMREHCRDAPLPEPNPEDRLEAYVIDLDFRQIKDERRRRSLLSMITSFFLPSEDVEALIRAGWVLLREHPEFQRLMRDLRREDGTQDRAEDTGGQATSGTKHRSAPKGQVPRNHRHQAAPELSRASTDSCLDAVCLFDGSKVQ